MKHTLEVKQIAPAVWQTTTPLGRRVIHGDLLTLSEELEKIPLPEGLKISVTGDLDEVRLVKTSTRHTFRKVVIDVEGYLESVRRYAALNAVKVPCPVARALAVFLAGKLTPASNVWFTSAELEAVFSAMDMEVRPELACIRYLDNIGLLEDRGRVWRARREVIWNLSWRAEDVRLDKPLKMACRECPASQGFHNVSKAS